MAEAVEAVPLHVAGSGAAVAEAVEVVVQHMGPLLLPVLVMVELDMVERAAALTTMARRPLLRPHTIPEAPPEESSG